MIFSTRTEKKKLTKKSSYKNLNIKHGDKPEIALKQNTLQQELFKDPPRTFQKWIPRVWANEKINKYSEKENRTMHQKWRVFVFQSLQRAPHTCRRAECGIETDLICVLPTSRITKRSTASFPGWWPFSNRPSHPAASKETSTSAEDRLFTRRSSSQ